MLAGTPFEMPSLGSMSRDALFKTCCAISDVDDPVQLDMEFVGGALKAVDSTLGIASILGYTLREKSWFCTLQLL